MGPSPERDGNIIQAGVGGEGIEASMGPSPERDGNMSLNVHGVSIDMLQWGHPLKGMEI